jgi:hypothetical protein
LPGDGILRKALRQLVSDPGCVFDLDPASRRGQECRNEEGSKTEEDDEHPGDKFTTARPSWSRHHPTSSDEQHGRDAQQAHEPDRKDQPARCTDQRARPAVDADEPDRCRRDQRQRKVVPRRNAIGLRSSLHGWVGQQDGDGGEEDQ